MVFNIGVTKEFPVANKLVAATSEYQLTLVLFTKAVRVSELLPQAVAPTVCKFKSIMFR